MCKRMLSLAVVGGILAGLAQSALAAVDLVTLPAARGCS